MKTFTAFFCLLFVASGVLADVYSAAIQQAKNVTANASNTRQDNSPAPTQPPSTPPAQNTPPPDPVLEATLQNIAGLRADFDACGHKHLHIDVLHGIGMDHAVTFAGVAVMRAWQA